MLPPILDAQQKIGRTQTGRHLHSNIGAMWDARTGAPVLSVPSLVQLLRAVMRDVRIEV